MAVSCRATPRYSHAAIIHELATASGSQALIGGQVADTEGEGRKISAGELRYIHENKTAALITASIRLGAMSANATAAQLRRLTEFGNSLGLAFQVIDDILDVTQTSEELGQERGQGSQGAEGDLSRSAGSVPRTKRGGQIDRPGSGGPSSLSARRPSRSKQSPITCWRGKN